MASGPDSLSLPTTILLVVLLLGFMVLSTTGQVLKRANPNTIQDKFLVGYQGWFTCAGDGHPVHRGHHGWLHWFNVPIPDGGRPTIDSWPDVSEYTPSELFPAPGLTLADGTPAQLFSSRHPQTVQRHFHWMAEHGVDGCFLQRFAGQCEVDGRTEGTNADIMRLRDEVGDRVREAAEKEGRVFAIMYDVSGVPAERIEKVIRVDWAHLVRDKRVLDSPNYLREHGRPVIALWGFGFAGRGHSPGVVRDIVRHIRATTPGGAYVMAGAPTHWQILKNDADPNPEFLDVWYNEFDAISPWTVGRYHNEETADRFAKEKIAKDIEAIKNNSGGRKVDYIPVVFPGASGFNLSQGKWAFNEQARDGGRFLWRQLYNVRKAGVRIIYGAMWDEYDEGTAFLPVVSKKRELPTPGSFLALDADGYDLPPDWFMRIAGFAGEILRGERPVHETFPVKDLQDYWSSRPRYEPAPASSQSGASSSSSSTAGPSGSGSADGSQSYEAWCEQEKKGVEDLPPPPYSLEATSSAAVAGSTAPLQQQQQQSQPQQPPVPVQTRPASLPAEPSSSSYNVANGPSSVERPQIPTSSRPYSSEVASWNQAQGSSHYQPPLAYRPTSLPSSSSPSSPSHQMYPSPSGTLQGRKPSGPAPGEIFRHPQSPFSPTQLQHAPQQPNWNTRPQQQQPYTDPARTYSHLAPRPPNSPRPSVSVSSLNEKFKKQSLGDAQTHNMHNPYSSQNPNGRPSTQGQFSAAPNPPPRPATAAQWPPPEWGMQAPQAPPRPSTLPPPQHPQRPPPSPFQGHFGSSQSPMSSSSSSSSFGRSSSTSPVPPPNAVSHAGAPMPPLGWGEPEYARYAAFPQPATDSGPHQSQAPCAQHMMPAPPRRRQSGSSVPPPLPPSEPSAYPSAYPDATHNHPMPSPGGRDYEYEYDTEAGMPGGFYTGQLPRPQYAGSTSASSPGPGSVYPPQVPPRPPGMTASVSPGQIMPTPQHRASPGGMIPGRFGDVASGAYSRTVGAVSKFAGTNTLKRVEGGFESLSSAGSKVYQRFRN